jgi:hypothetical protein
MGVPDPAAVRGKPEEIVRAFRDAFVVLDSDLSRKASGAHAPSR